MGKENDDGDEWKYLDDNFFPVEESLEELLDRLPEIDRIAQDYVLGDITRIHNHPVKKNALLFEYFKRKKFNHELYSIFRKYITLLKKEDKYLDNLIKQVNGKK